MTPRLTLYVHSSEILFKSLIHSHMNQEAGKPARGIAARLLQKSEEQEADYRKQYWALGSFYLAGSDTQNVSSQILMYAQVLIYLSLSYLDADALPSAVWH